jgi:hypothetical protein
MTTSKTIAWKASPPLKLADAVTQVVVAQVKNVEAWRRCFSR